MQKYKKIFIDCGANQGQTVALFKVVWEDHKEYEIHSFEARPGMEVFFKDLIKEPNYHFYNKAVSTFDGKASFYLSTQNNWGSSLVKEKKSSGLNKEKPAIVECIDISKWIKEKFSKEDYIILKIDIEGAEYQVLPHMLESDVFLYINEIYIEFHNLKVGVSKSTDLELLSKLESYTNLKVNNSLEQTYSKLAKQHGIGLS